MYIDKNDPRLPNVTSKETALILRDTVSDCRRFDVFVTVNNKDSNWIPWELGLADGLKGENSVALFPTSERGYDKSWAEQEFLGLYQRIVWGEIKGMEEPGWIVHDHQVNTARKLRDWLRG